MIESKRRKKLIFLFHDSTDLVSSIDKSTLVTVLNKGNDNRRLCLFCQSQLFYHYFVWLLGLGGDDDFSAACCEL